MKISFNWLREFVDIPDDPKTFAGKITMVGLAVDTLETVGDDVLFEFDVTTNRPDCLNHVGMAREASAIYGTTLRLPQFKLQESDQDADDVFSISIADPDLCERYCGRYIEGVRIGPSPDWLKARLEVLGVRSINNVADITNYVMMELGHPQHAFDADTLEQQQIIVRRADLDETITTLDGVERKLNPAILVIADGRRPVAVAGVMGGAETEISSKTVNVLLESAHFNPTSIRKTSRALGLSTEASYRYERGADIEMARYACDRAAALIRELAGGKVYRGLIDVYPVERKPKVVQLRRERIARFLGASVEDGIVERIFSRLGFHTAKSATGWAVTVPSHRVDVGIEEDLLEEIARHHGYDQFPSTLPPWSGFGSGLPYEKEERRLRTLLSSCGYSETYGFSLSDEESENRFRPEIKPVRLMNPMTEDGSILRTSLVSSILKSIQWNLNRGARDLQFYELGNTYWQADFEAGSEERRLIFAATGVVRPKTVHGSLHEVSFFDIKGDVEEILAEFSVHADVSRAELPPYYHPGRAARLGAHAIVGELHPDYADALKVKQRIILAELEVEPIIRSRSRRPIAPPPRFPSIRRDLSLMLERTTTYGQIRDTIDALLIPELVHIEPFDRLSTAAFSETHYSLSISLIYQSAERTLTDTEVEEFDRRILDALEQRHGAQLRK